MVPPNVSRNHVSHYIIQTPPYQMHSATQQTLGTRQFVTPPGYRTFQDTDDALPPSYTALSLHSSQAADDGDNSIFPPTNRNFFFDNMYGSAKS